MVVNFDDIPEPQLQAMLQENLYHRHSEKKVNGQIAQ